MLFYLTWKEKTDANLFINFFLSLHTFKTDIDPLHSSISFDELHIYFSSLKGLHWGSEPRFELGAALQQPNGDDGLPTELRLTQLSYVALY